MNEMTSEPLSGEAIELDRTAPAKKRRRLAIMLSVPLLIAAIGLYFWLTSGHSVSDRQCLCEAGHVSVSAQVVGPVSECPSMRRPA